MNSGSGGRASTHSPMRKPFVVSQVAAGAAGAAAWRLPDGLTVAVADGLGVNTELLRMRAPGVSAGKPFSAEMFSALMFSAEMFSAEMFCGPVLATTVAWYCRVTLPVLSTHAPIDDSR